MFGENLGTYRKGVVILFANCKYECVEWGEEKRSFQLKATVMGETSSVWNYNFVLQLGRVTEILWDFLARLPFTSGSRALGIGESSPRLKNKNVMFFEQMFFHLYMWHPFVLFYFYFYFFPPMPPRVVVDLVILPPGHSRIVTDFWGWDAVTLSRWCEWWYRRM